MPVYVVVGGFLLILVMLLAGNLAFYKMYGLDGIERSLDDAMRFRFHIGFSSDYLKYYGAAASLYVIGALLIYGDNQKYKLNIMSNFFISFSYCFQFINKL